MVKIFIDPGHGGNDPGAVANGIQEKNITLQISLIIREILLTDYEGVSVLMSRTGDETVSLPNRTNAANNWGADYYVSVHINSGGGKGFESFVYQGAPRQTIAYQNHMHQHIMAQTALFVDRGMKQADFHVLRESKMDAILTENGFIDHASDAANLKNADFIEQVARGHALGIASAFQLKRKQQEAQPVQQDEEAVSSSAQTILYIVQIGAYSERENAEEMALQAKEKGFQTYIKQIDQLYKVQVGAFTQRNHAEELVQKAKDAGLNAVIITN